MYNPNKQTWLNPNIEYLFNEDITEYDIRDAGFSIIKEFKLLPQVTISWLNNLNKGLERHIAIGNLQREDKGFSDALTRQFAEVRRIFIETNGIGDDDIISVKKDAIFTTKDPHRLDFGQVHFVSKNKYTSYIRFSSNHNLEIYYVDGIADIKGIGDIAIRRHNLYIIEFIKKICRMIEIKDSRTKRYLIEFVMKYKAHELDDEYYIEFNNRSNNIDMLYNYTNVIIPLVLIIMKELQ